MKATEVAAWIGCATGVSSNIWDAYKWKTSGPKLRVTTNPRMVRMEGQRDKKYIMVRVRNVGKTKTTITTIAFSTFQSWWARRRLKRGEAGMLKTGKLLV